MINSEDRTQKLIELIEHASAIDENSVIEYKVKPHTMGHQCEFYKDVLALLNSYNRPTEDRWLIYGVRNENRVPVGFDANDNDLLDDASYQQLFDRIDPRPHIELVHASGRDVLGPTGSDKLFAALYIPSENFGSVYEMNTDIRDKELKRGKSDHVFLQKGSSFVHLGSSIKPLQEEDRVRIRATDDKKRLFHRYPQIVIGTSQANTTTNDDTTTPTDPVDNLRLLGSWDERNMCDRQAIARLCCLPYEHTVRLLANDLDNGLFIVSNSIWHVQDRLSMVEAIGPHLTNASLSALASHLGSIIVSADEMYELPESQRLIANAIGTCRGCSRAARIGAASLCAILANNLALLPNCTMQGIEAFVLKVLEAVFSTDNWRVLASADDAFPLLAQTFPSFYLSSITRSIRDRTAIAELLDQESGGPFSSKLGSGLLHGICIAAMKEESLSQAISVLVKLLPNTDMAKEAIVSILLPWLPQTEASTATRKGMGRYLARQDDSVAWQTLLNLLPNRRTSTLSISKPEYLESHVQFTDASHHDYWEVSREYCRDVLLGAKGHFSRIVDVIDCLDSFKACCLLDEAVRFASSECPSLTAMENYTIWSMLLSYTERCKRHPDADWAPTASELDTIVATVNELTPKDSYYLALRSCTLDDYKLSQEVDIHNRHSISLQKRQDALHPLYKTNGLTIIIRLIDDGAKGHYVGEALAEISISTNDEQALLAFLNNNTPEDHHRLDAARSYIWSKYKKDERAWVDSLPLTEWPPQQTARFFAALPFSKKTWEEAESLLGQRASLYWAEVPYAYITDNAIDITHCVNQLLKVNRAAFSLELIHNAIEAGVSVNADIVMDAISHVQDTDIDVMCTFYIEELFKYVEESAPSDRLYTLELRFAVILHNRPDSYVFQKLSKDPKLFAQVVALAYEKSNLDKESEGSSKMKKWAIRHYVLENWKTTPGKDEDGTFREPLFNTWLTAAREEAERLNIARDAEFEIGRNLFHAQQNLEGSFLPEAIALFLEESESALNGFAAESVNSRGVHFVDPTGKEEDVIANSFEQKALSAEEHGYARLSARLRDLSKSYRPEAEENRCEGRSSTYWK